MNAFGFEAAFTSRREFPAYSACLRIQRVEFAVVTNGVKHAAIYRRSRRHRAARSVFPKLTPARSINRVDVPVVTTEVNRAIAPNRRRHNAIAGWKFPFEPVKLAWGRARVDARMRRIAAEH